MKLILFDVDGALVPNGGKIQEDMIECLNKIREMGITLGIVGGGEYDKISDQLDGNEGYFSYIFTDLGAVLHVDGKRIVDKNMLDHCDRDMLNSIIRVAMVSICSMPILYHGGQVNVRKGSIYVTPSGVQATSYEKEMFMEIDKRLGLIDRLVMDIKSVAGFTENFDIVMGELGCTFYLKGWDKTSVLNSIPDHFDDIYFLGDRTYVNGIDYSLYSHERVKGHSVANYQDCISKIETILSMEND